MKFAILICSLVLITACNKSGKENISPQQDESTVQHYPENFFAGLDHFMDHDSGWFAMKVIDSAYALLPTVSIADKWRYYQQLAILYAAEPNFSGMDTSVIYTDSMRVLIENNGKTVSMASQYLTTFNFKADYCLFLQRYNEAVKAISMSRFLSRRSNDSCTTGNSSSTLGMIAYRQARYREAAEYFKEAVVLFPYCSKERDRFYMMQNNLDNTGLAYYRAGETDSALKYYLRTIDYVEKNKELYKHDTLFPYISLGVVYYNLGELYFDQKNYPAAALYYEKQAAAINIQPQGDGTDKASAEINIAKTYIKLGKIKEAAALLNHSVPLVSLLNTNQRSLWNRQMADIAKAGHDTRRELYFLKQASFLQDRWEQEKKEMFAPDPNVEYDRLEKKYQAGLLEKNISQQQAYTRTALWIGLLILLLLLVVYVSLKRSRRHIDTMNGLNNGIIKRKEQLQKVMDEIEQRVKKERKDELFFQEIRLQMEFNDAIGAQRRKISEDMHDGLSSSVAALHFLLIDMKRHAQSREGEKILADINGEVASIYSNVRHYMHNLRRDNGKIRYTLVSFLKGLAQNFSQQGALQTDLILDAEKIEQSLSISQQDHLCHIAREAISNIIKHANATHMKITVDTRQEECYFSIFDNGRGFKEEEVLYGTGLNSIQQRVKELGGGLSIDSTAAGTTVSVSFSFEHEFVI